MTPPEPPFRLTARAPGGTLLVEGTFRPLFVEVTEEGWGLIGEDEQGRRAQLRIPLELLEGCLERPKREDLQQGAARAVDTVLARHQFPGA